LRKRSFPGFGDEPERRRHTRPNGRTVGPRRALALATLHSSAHFGVDLFDRPVADLLLVIDDVSSTTFLSHLTRRFHRPHLAAASFAMHNFAAR
jgi:hypothetical protein